MSSEKARIIELQGNYVRVDHPVMPSTPMTLLSEFADVGATSLTVGDNAGLANTDNMLIGNPGQDGTGLAAINAAVTYGRTIPITAAVLQFDIDSPIRKVLWQKVEIAWADTLAGAKTALVPTTNILWSGPYTEVSLELLDKAFWFVRYVDFTGAVYSEWSDGIPSAGYGPTTVRGVIEGSLEKGDYKIQGKLTDEVLRKMVQGCEMDIYQMRRRWAQFDRNDVSLGTLSAGVRAFDVPDDIVDPDTMESIRTVRIKGIPDVRYIIRDKYDQLRWDLASGALIVEAVVGDIILELDSVDDFQDTGSVKLGSDDIAYTGVDRTLKRLTGVTGITETWDIGMEAMQGSVLQAVPLVATIMDRKITFPFPATSEYYNRGVFCNYYAIPTYPKTDSQIVNFSDAQLYHWYIAWHIELFLHNGTETKKAKSHKENYVGRVRLLLNRSRTQDNYKLIPKRPYPRQNAADNNNPNIIGWKLS